VKELSQELSYRKQIARHAASHTISIGLNITP